MTPADGHVPPPAPPSKRALAKARTRARVLEAARRLFAERGYDRASIRDIAREAGLSTGAIFAGFRDKADLYAQAMHRTPPSEAAVAAARFVGFRAGWRAACDRIARGVDEGGGRPLADAIRAHRDLPEDYVPAQHGEAA